MMELVWTPEAIQDRDDIYDYIEPQNPLAALTLDELFQGRRHSWWTSLTVDDLAVFRDPESWLFTPATYWSTTL
ncbi:type II toxin-antitoxin system RelE/ParE family toxin [Halomonas sp. DP8Y7-1]|uniref:type II toxin-antitoxin system RelE/ParE family toxin n=1 Tax=Halomonas sp. DP8Y7-1 TaxID=2859078 RepID=UPI0021BD18E5|nr:type II toxin-antitoxin system RelE/ParE family toxin [Halomonas sp. DP8Y7-1]